jgi:hypothetical protein
MTASRPVPKVGESRIGKQIMLPWSKAIEIAAKSIHVRFWRSMITMSSVVLAIAFLMSIWTSTSIVAALAVGPQRDIEGVKQRLSVVRAALQAGAGAPSADEVKTRFARDLAAADARSRDAIAEKTRAMPSASSEEAKKLEEEIKGLEADLAPANALPFLQDYLLARRRELERRQGDLNRILQQERVGREQEQAPAVPRPEGSAPAARARSFVTDFLSHMSPADKWLAILALLVCFVGIVNAMFMTVQERFREIGTMKCLGALDLFIVKIFLIESAALGLIGTLLGIVVGLTLATLRQLVVYGGAVLTYFPIANLIVAAVLAALIGLILSIFAAIFPARKAAQMEPVEAMRIEE